MSCCRICDELESTALPPQPTTIEGYRELDVILKELSQLEPDDWWRIVRWYTSHDLTYLTTRVSMLRGLVNPVSGLPLFERQWVLDHLDRPLEKDPDAPIMASRGIGKTSKRIMQNVQRVLKWPNIAICLFSFQRDAAQKRLASTRAELENPLLVKLFPEVLYENPKDPENGSDSWNLAKGLNVRRDSSRQEHTFEAHALRLHTLPTGSHYNVLDFDDVEDDKVVRSPDQIADLKYCFAQAQHLWTSPVWRPFTGTPYHQSGLVIDRINRNKDRALVYPGEDLETPGDGPLGGTPVYFTQEELWALYEEIGDPDSYAMQVALSTSRGTGRRFSRQQWQIYNEDPLELGRRCFVYICIDPSLGLHDPTAHWVWGTTLDRKFAWLDGSSRKMAPGERLEETWRLYSKWQQVSLGVRHIRIEEVGQAHYAEPTKEFLRRRGIYVDVHRCTRGGGPGMSKMELNWQAWHPMAAERRLMAPRTIWQYDDSRKPQNLVDYFFDYEWEEFPRPATDNLLDAGGLIAYPEQKIKGRNANIIFPNQHDVEMVDLEDDEVESAYDGRSYLSSGPL